MVSDRADAALVALLIPAMHARLNICVRGTVSAELLHEIRHGVQKILVSVVPSLKTVQITCDNCEPCLGAAGGILTGFSAGVDSYSTIADYHLSSELPDSLKISHLGLFNIWSPQEGDKGRPFEKHLRRVGPIAEQLGLPLIAVDTNVSWFYREIEYSESHTLRNAAVGFLLQKGVGRFLYSSAYALPVVQVAPGHNIAIADSILLPLLSTPQLTLNSVGGEYTRVEKTMQVSQLPIARRSLFVCSGPWSMGKNCSVCGKCLRTQLTLEIGGVLSLFDSVFHPDLYESRRASYITRVLGEIDDPFMQEIRQFALEKGYTFPFYARLTKWPWRAARYMQSLLRGR